MATTSVRPKRNGRAEYVCRACGAATPKWLGRCADCGEWNSLTARESAASPRALDVDSIDLADVNAAEFDRLRLSGGEVNRVLGGGIVRGSLVLVGGDPGVGKSTLLLQIADEVAREHGPAAYVSGEESPHQIKLRADRLGVVGRGLRVIAETDLDAVLGSVRDASLLIIDSVQTMFVRDAQAAPGSVAQVRECALRLLQWAKTSGVPVLIAGHVTKDGAIAGPRLLEHMVDVVLYLEGEGTTTYRILRGVKNRFGSTSEVGIFEMRDAGLVEVENASEVFLVRRERAGPGSVIVPTMEGTRPLLVEVQALVTYSPLAVPRRMANGFDQSRLHMLIAVLTKRAGLRLADQDVYVNVVGGLELDEPAVDLAVCMAIASSVADVALPGDMVSIGEVGLAGELRSVFKLEERVLEAARRGYNRVLLPRTGTLGSLGDDGLDLSRAESVRQSIRLALGKAQGASRKGDDGGAREGTTEEAAVRRQ